MLPEIREDDNLHYMRQFYMAFPIVNTLCSQLSWSHYRLLMKVNDTSARDFYMNECAEESCSLINYLHY